MQLKFLTLGFISAALFSNVVVASGSLVDVKDTNVHISQVLVDILNNLRLNGLLKDADIRALSGIADSGRDKRSVLSRRKLAKALARREWEADEDENEEDEDEDEDEEDEDENEEDEDEEDEDEEDEDEEDEDEADESSVSKVARRSTEESEEVTEDATEEGATEEEDETEEEEEETEEEATEEEGSTEEEDDENVMRMSRRLVPGVDGLLGSEGNQNAATDRGSKGGVAGGLTSLASNLAAGV